MLLDADAICDAYYLEENLALLVGLPLAPRGSRRRSCDYPPTPDILRLPCRFNTQQHSYAPFVRARLSLTPQIFRCWNLPYPLSYRLAVLSISQCPVLVQQKKGPSIK